MALIDYGAVVFKNGVIQNENNFFMDMQKSVGWSSEQKGNYYAFVGNERLTVAVSRNACHIFTDKKIFLRCHGMHFFDQCDVLITTNPHIKKVIRFVFDNIGFRIKEITFNVYMLSFSFENNHYNIIYGYGIDPDLRVWEHNKVRYLGKKGAAKVDKIYSQIKNNSVSK